MPIKNTKRFVEALDNGQNWLSYFYKTGSSTSPITNVIYDLSMASGLPKYNAYVGPQATATPLIGSANEGINLGPNPPAGKHRYISRVMLDRSVASTVNTRFTLLDYVMFYPLIDGDDTEIQVLDNTNSLPRYADGKGIRIMPVCTTPMTGNGDLTITYTNQDGVAGRVSTCQLVGTFTVTGVCITAGVGTGANTALTPFFPLQGNDTGVRSIQQVQLTSAVGGFFCLALVKPLLELTSPDLQTASELVLPFQRGGNAPKLYEGAYLNFIANPVTASAPVPFFGSIETVWN